MATQTANDLSWVSLLDTMRLIESRIDTLKADVTRLVYAVRLLQKACPDCHQSRLVMIRDGWCRCECCGREIDATTEFQTCAVCDGPLVLRICRYWCSHCRTPARSLFRLYARIFDAEYFTEKMRASRAREQDRIEAVTRMLANSRSAPLAGVAAPSVELSSLAADVAGFLEGLRAVDRSSPVTEEARFDMARYRTYLRELVDGCTVEFEGIAQLSPDRRHDRIWRFVTVVFMDQEGALRIQQGPDGRIVLYGP